MITCILISIGGVLIPPMEELILAWLTSQRGEPLDHVDRNWVRTRCMDFHTGALEIQSLCREVSERTDVDLNVETLPATLLRSAPVDEGVLGVIDELIEKYEITALADLPRSWLIPHLAALGLTRRLDERRFIFVDELRITRLLPGLLETSLERLAHPSSDVLLVDARSDVTTAAVRAGVNAILHVNAFRTRQELGLRGLLPPI